MRAVDRSGPTSGVPAAQRPVTTRAPDPTTASTSVATTTTTTTTSVESATALTTPWGPATLLQRTTATSTTVTTQQATASRLDARTPASPDGRRFARERLAELATLARLGVPTAVVFDLDNTVFDTRHRTLSAGRAFDVAKGTSFFQGVGVDQMGVDGRSTATALGLVDPHHADFVAFWDIHFWTPEHLAHDEPVADMVALVQEAKAAGVRVSFLTGRIQSFHEASLAQLRRAGLDVDANDVVCKPDLSVRTGPFKSEWLTGMQARGIEIGFFVTEGVRDLTHLASAMPDLPLLRLDCSFEDGAALRHLPTWPAPF